MSSFLNQELVIGDPFSSRKNSDLEEGGLTLRYRSWAALGHAFVLVMGRGIVDPRLLELVFDLQMVIDPSFSFHLKLFSVRVGRDLCGSVQNSSVLRPPKKARMIAVDRRISLKLCMFITLKICLILSPVRGDRGVVLMVFLLKLALNKLILGSFVYSKFPLFVNWRCLIAAKWPLKLLTLLLDCFRKAPYNRMVSAEHGTAFKL